MRIAIVGAGVSGLVATHLLAPDHDAVLLEAGDCAGGHTHTVRSHLVTPWFQRMVADLLRFNRERARCWRATTPVCRCATTWSRAATRPRSSSA